MPKKEPAAIRFWRKVKKESNGCWNWTDYSKKRRRGYLSTDRGFIAAHRFAYILLVGPIPEGIYVCHHCDNPICVNPKHLFLGTQDDNMKDMKNKDRANKPKGELNGRAKLTDDAVRFIRKNWKFRSKEFSQKQLAVMFGVGTFAIQEVLYNKKWTHVR